MLPRSSVALFSPNRKIGFRSLSGEHSCYQESYKQAVLRQCLRRIRRAWSSSLAIRLCRAGQDRIIALFHGSIERIHVDMDDLAMGRRRDDLLRSDRGHRRIIELPVESSQPLDQVGPTDTPGGYRRSNLRPLRWRPRPPRERRRPAHPDARHRTHVPGREGKAAILHPAVLPTFPVAPASLTIGLAAQRPDRGLEAN